mmetsp:Transcript_33096/g.82310  ORF Transcript_33096/g.82310 Transcript_33096/m.82310 type:complete len:228 (-) Transcript_33096:93-776(-)
MAAGPLARLRAQRLLRATMSMSAAAPPLAHRPLVRAHRRGRAVRDCIGRELAGGEAGRELAGLLGSVRQRRLADPWRQAGVSGVRGRVIVLSEHSGWAGRIAQRPDGRVRVGCGLGGGRAGGAHARARSARRLHDASRRDARVCALDPRAERPAAGQSGGRADATPRLAAHRAAEQAALVRTAALQALAVWVAAAPCRWRQLLRLPLVHRHPALASESAGLRGARPR